MFCVTTVTCLPRSCSREAMAMWAAFGFGLAFVPIGAFATSSAPGIHTGASRRER